MPAQLSTIIYVSEYKEKTTTGYFVGVALGHARLEDESTQTFSMTVFYPIDESKPCYVPKLKEGQVLSIGNSKFTKSTINNGEIDMRKNIFVFLFK